MSLNLVRKPMGKTLTAITFFLIASGNTGLLASTFNTWSDSGVSVVCQTGESITGTIIDTSGLPVIGANVMVKGTSVGAITDLDGKYQVNAKPGVTLVISFIGYETIEVKAANGQTIQLREDAQALSEVVVVGYSSQKRESLTGALSTIKKDKLTNITTPSVTNMLNGKVPGVYVAPGTGQPGAEGTIIIRGKSTVNGSTDPLWIVDGVIVGSNPGALNPSDVETVTVLKDAASTAIYGSQGANGVIVVTTKAAKADKMSINFSAKGGVSMANSGNLKMMNGTQLYDFYNSFSNSEVLNFPKWTPELRNQNFDWWDLATQTGFMQEYNVSITGGTEKIRSFFSAGIYDESGAIKGYDYTRYNVRYKADFRPYKWLTIKPMISGSIKDVEDRQYSAGAWQAMLPWDNPYDENGNPVPHRSDLWVSNNQVNYIYDLALGNHTNSSDYEFMGNLDFDIKFTDWLTFSSVNSYRWKGYFQSSYADPKGGYTESVNGRISEWNDRKRYRYTNQLLRFNKLFGGKHSVNALLAYEFNDYRYKSVNAQGTGFSSGFEVLDVTAIPEVTDGGITEWAVQSYLFNAHYAYDNRYLAQVSFRRDGSSNFGDNAKYGNFFSVSAGWNLHNESWFKADWVDNLKLRASYGSVGNRPTSYYPQYDLYSVSNTYNGQSALLISQIGNQDMTWEKTFTTGIGIDASFFNRLRLTLDYYQKRTKDMLYEVPLPSMVGVTRIWRNVGESENQGFEAVIGVDILKSKDLLWTVDMTIGLNRNKVTKLYGNDPEIILGDGTGTAGSASKILTPGLDTDTWYLREWAGVDPADGSPLWYKNTLNPDGTRNRETTKTYAEAKQVDTGSFNPDFYGSFSTTFNYKDFDLNAVFGYSVGGDLYHFGRYDYDSDGYTATGNYMALPDGWSRWEKPGDIATHPVPSMNNSSGSRNPSTRYLESGSYLKLRSLSVGYNLSLPKWHIQNARIYLSGENLFCITDYSGVDPEVPTKNGKIIGVAGGGAYPSIRKVTLGLNLTF